MTLPFNPLRAADLARQAMEDDERMSDGPWTAGLEYGYPWIEGQHDEMLGDDATIVEWDNTGDVAKQNSQAIARTRNALREMGEQLMAAVERIAQLEANAITMREYRFALEGIATDGNGNPVEKAGKP